MQLLPLPPIGLIIALIFVIGLVISIRSRKSQIVRACKNCGSNKMVQVSHETLHTKPVDMHNGNFLPGADIRLQLEQDLTYRCEVCNQLSVFRVTSTP